MIVRAVLDCDSRVKVEALVLVLLTISADPRSRHYLQLETVLPRLLAPFTDRNYCHTTKTATQDGRNTSIEGQQLLSASSYAVVCVLQTWPGVLSLCATELGVASLVQILTIDQKDFNVHNSLLAYVTLSHRRLVNSREEPRWWRHSTADPPINEVRGVPPSVPARSRQHATLYLC